MKVTLAASRARRTLVGASVFVALTSGFVRGVTTARAIVAVSQTFHSVQAQDQDDMCLWIHPEDPTLSLVVGSDKASGEVYVYDLSGTLRQTIPTGKPGNIDVRYGISFGGECVDIIAFNERAEYLIRVYKVDPDLRLLERIDDGAISTGRNYGFTLHKHPNGNLYAFTGPDDTPVQQYLLFENASGQISGTATGWSASQGIVEGMVADDETGYVYLSEEQVGIWRINALDDTDKVLIAQVGDASGLQADVEGITIYYAGGGQGYLIASSQGASRFTVLERQAPHTPVGNFELSGVGATDGIDVVSMPLNDVFTAGVFLAHNGSNPATLVAARWQDVVASLPALQTDTTYWDPRACGVVSSRDEATFSPSAPVVLHQNVPNPFNPATSLHYEVAQGSHVRLQIFDLAGRKIRSLMRRWHEPGDYDVVWDGRDEQGRVVASGLYLARLDTDISTSSIKMLLAR